MVKEYNILHDEFIDKINEFAKEEPFQLYYLFTAVEIAHYDSTPFYDAFVLEKEECQIIGLRLRDIYYFYGKNWTKIDLDVIKNRINFKALPKGFHIAGTLNLISEILNKVEINTATFKNRFFYKITSNPKVVLNSSHLISEPEGKDVKELAGLYQEYFKEEYNGLNNKTIEETTEAMRKIISEFEIYIVKNQNEIMGFCTTMFSDSDQPMIGTLFVRKKNRNEGIGKTLIHYVTRKLMVSARVCYLMTDKGKIEANKIMKSIGYFRIYEHTDRIIAGSINNFS